MRDKLRAAFTRNQNKMALFTCGRTRIPRILCPSSIQISLSTRKSLNIHHSSLLLNKGESNGNEMKKKQIWYYKNKEEAKLTATTVEKKKPIWYYNNKGIRKRKIDQLIRNSSANSETSSDEITHIKRLVQTFNSYGFTEKEIRNMFYHKPKILQITKKKLQKQFSSILRLDIPRDVAKDMVLKCPSLLLLDDEVLLQKRLNHLQELPLFPRLSQERCVYLVQKCPQILLISEKSIIYGKVKNLLVLSFNQQQMFELIMKHPAVLTYSKESVSEKVNYIVQNMGGRLALFTKFPRILSASLKRIKERHLFLIEEGYLKQTSYISENKLRAIVLTTDNDFIYRITKTKMKDYRLFQDTLHKGSMSSDSSEGTEYVDNSLGHEESYKEDLNNEPTNTFKITDLGGLQNNIRNTEEKY